MTPQNGRMMEIPLPSTQTSTTIRSKAKEEAIEPERRRLDKVEYVARPRHQVAEQGKEAK